ncbi:MAG: FAD-dependent oxidoreductase [Oscillospiraceae bacterium]|jgi:formate dehydrogenase major subunit|nr:FAD-dependent oxidoreductase [Oscillospiraceae bacterium]
MNSVQITVNGRAINASMEKTLLQNLLENGVYVPNLCFNKNLESYGGCGLCLVAVEGLPKPVRSCSMKPSAGMNITTDTPEIVASRNTSLSLMHADHRGDCIAPCRRACPTNQDAQGYIGLIADGKYEEALRLIKEDNPLPASIGRVCPHPCEDACRRKHAEGSVSICSLKRFAADTDGNTYTPDCKPSTGKRAAIIGAGPAGLSCAYFLAREGHTVTIFEAMPKSGGMLRYGIPHYRLTDKVLDGEVAAIERLGVTIEYNKTLGRDFTIPSLKEQYDAVFVAVGAWQSTALRCENDDLPGVLGGIDFLREVAEGKRPEIGKRVAVVGGGNTAMDAVRTARRLGAQEVVLVYRRTRDEMPASEWEIEEAEDEGVKFMFLSAPEAVYAENGRAAGLVIQKCELGEPDDSGRRRPVPIACALQEERFDTIIAAIGQKVVTEGLDPLAMTRWGTIIADKNTFQTNLDGVFAGGDAVNNGPDIAIQAIAHGKHAARAIGAYFNGTLSSHKAPFYVEKTKEVSREIGEVPFLARVKDTFLPPDERIQHFNETNRTFTQEEARREASRCLECGCSAYYDCRLLPLLQMHEITHIPLKSANNVLPEDHSHPFIWRDNNKCILCGLCVRVCKEVVGKEVLGFDARGFSTTVECAFHTPLAHSDCISCGACTAVCPTGALQDKRAFTKTPPLPFSVKTVVCEHCENRCAFDVYSHGRSIIKAIPDDIRKTCSIGRYGLTLQNNGAVKDIGEEAAGRLKKALLGDLDYFKGTLPSFDSTEDIMRYYN